MTDAEVLERVYQALPADGSFCAFANVAERLDRDVDDLYERLRDLEQAGRAELVHGRGWRRGDVPHPTHDDPREGYMERVAEIVGRAGHMVQFVMGDAAKDVAPFAYTVGLLDRLGFELVVTGALPPETLQAMLNAAAVLDPFPNRPAEHVGKVIGGTYTVALVDTTAYRCAEAGYPLNIARAWNVATGVVARESDDFPAVQIVWPDSEYRYPWQAGYSYVGKLGGQPMLGDPPPRH